MKYTILVIISIILALTGISYFAALRTIETHQTYLRDLEAGRVERKVQDSCDVVYCSGIRNEGHCREHDCNWKPRAGLVRARCF